MISEARFLGAPKVPFACGRSLIWVFSLLLAVFQLPTGGETDARYLGFRKKAARALWQ